MKLQKYSFGSGDRFGHQAQAQLSAVMKARQQGVEIVPVWNKSNREHSIIGTTPADVRREADRAVEALKWTDSYYVDADHINLTNVDRFIDHSDFFTLDVADYIGKQASGDDMKQFMAAASKYTGALHIPGVDEHLDVTGENLRQIAEKFLFAVKEAGRIYRHIENAKGKDNFVTEVSMDETDAPQSPVDMFFILLMMAQERIPAQTIAPKFTGRFNKGVDYVGEVCRFEKEFNQDLAVIRYGIAEFGLPSNLKLSVHSGSDKFAIYESIRKALKRFDAGLHLKTAGTTWLEELVGLAEAGGDGLDIAKEIYAASLAKFDALCAPYATVIDIDKNALPSAEEVQSWDGHRYAGTLRHDPNCPHYNLNFRQLLHVGYKVAADMGPRYIGALETYEPIIARHVTENIYDRHIRKIFLEK